MLDIKRVFRLVAVVAALAATPVGAQQATATPPAVPGEPAGSALAQFRGKLQQLQNLQANNRYLETLLDDQQGTKMARRVALANLGTVQQGIVPHLFKLIDDLEAFIRFDLPFLPDERQRRIASLRAMMQSASLSVAEKYRLVIEAYQIEVAFGREVEAYGGWLEENGTRREVDFLRVGRIVLAYQTRDRAEAGFWNSQASPAGWQRLSARQASELARGLRIAMKQAAPDWLTLPVPAPAPVQAVSP